MKTPNITELERRSNRMHLMEEIKRLAGPKSAQGSMILAHLGIGVRFAVVAYGKSMDTSMGYTPPQAYL